MKKRTIKQIWNKVESLENRLKAKKICENFGDKEIRELDNFIGDIYSYDYFDKIEIISIQKVFMDWCANYKGV